MIFHDIETTRHDVRRLLAELGRPECEWHPIGRLRASMAAQRKWDSEHPERSQRRLELLRQLDELDAEQQRREDAARIEAHLERLVGSAGLGRRDVEAAKAPAGGEALSAAKTWWAQGDARKTWLVLLGATGTGKTVAAAVVAIEAIREGWLVEYARAAEVARLSSFDAGAARLDALRRAGLLVLDDVGIESLTPHAQETLALLCDERHAARRATVVCSNLDRKALAERLGARLADRIRGDGMVVTLKETRSRRTPMAVAS